MRPEQRRAVAWTVALAAVAGAAVVVARRQKRWQAWSAACNFIQSAKHVSDVTLELSRDTKAYLAGAADAPPRGIVRAVELLSSEPVLSRLQAAAQRAASAGPSVVQSVLDASLSERGQSLLALVASVSTARAVQALTAWLDAQPRGAGSAADSQPVQQLTAWLARPEAQALVSRCITDFVSAGTATYCEATIHINPYEQMLEAAARPEHLRVLRALTATACSSSVQALASACGQHGATAEPGCVTPAPQTNGHAAALALEDSALGAGRPFLLAAEPLVKNGSNGKHEYNGGAAHHADATQVAPAPGWLDVALAACRSGDVRRLCAEAAHAGAAGAVQAAADSFGASALGQRLADRRVQRLLVSGLVLWSLLLPLFVLHVLSAAVVV